MFTIVSIVLCMSGPLNLMLLSGDKGISPTEVVPSSGISGGVASLLVRLNLQLLVLLSHPSAVTHHVSLMNALTDPITHTMPDCRLILSLHFN
ncbi:hypothetical protein SLA2020_281990 [Shorea laevis]